MFLKKCYDHNIRNNEKENNAAVLILLTDANLKNLYWLMTAFHCVISNFEKKICSVVNKRLSPEVFTVIRFFTKEWVV